MSIYQDKQFLLASMHQKETAIRDPFQTIIGCKVDPIKNFDTDQFGTFSGEIERKLSALDTLKQKAIMAAKLYNHDYIISSEGSFGPHPTFFFTLADIEMMLFLDRNKDLFIIETEISTKTNFANFEITDNSNY